LAAVRIAAERERAMAEVLVLSEADVDGLLDLEQLLAALGAALASYSYRRLGR
jgi:hypothetical protein